MRRRCCSPRREEKFAPSRGGSARNRINDWVGHSFVEHRPPLRAREVVCYVLQLVQTTDRHTGGLLDSTTYGSVERDEGDGTSPVSTAEVCAAWVVLMVSAVSRWAHQQGFGRKCVGVRKKRFRGLLAEEACLESSLAHLGIAKGCPA